MRADRLVAVVLLLQAHGQLTAAQLAEMLETSERTIRRDLDSLCVAGVPLYSQRGRGGGWSLLGGHRLNLSGLTAEEASALFLVAGAQAGADDAGLRSALRKVLAALPEPVRYQAAAAEGAAVVDPVGWGQPRESLPFLDDLRTAVVGHSEIDIEYAKPGGAPEQRRVEPYGLVSKRGVWYLLAGTSGGRRTFRVSRVRGAAPTGRTFALPRGFQLADEWELAQKDFFARMSVIDVDLEVADRSALGLVAMLKGWAGMEEQPAATAGWRRFTASFPSVRAAAVQLAPFGGDVQVVSPLEVRAELLRIGEALVAANAGLLT